MSGLPFGAASDESIVVFRWERLDTAWAASPPDLASGAALCNALYPVGFSWVKCPGGPKAPPDLPICASTAG